MDEILKHQKTYYKNGGNQSLEKRINALKEMKAWILKNQERITNALNEDLGKHPFETTETEIMVVIDELNYFLKNTRKLMRTKRVSSPLVHFKSKSYRVPEPLGHILVIAPWNYPFQLAIAPVVSAIAAGNVVALKPSEMAESTARLIETMFEELKFDNLVSIHQGGVETSTQLLERRFDTIFFTGSSKVGSIVMEAAAKNLCPVILELGGKSPCIVDQSANLKLAARRIIWGKFVNAGQTCVAPDYILVDATQKESLVTYLKLEIAKLEPEDMARIVNMDHFKRLENYLDQQTILHQGTIDPSTLKMGLVLVDNPASETALMKEEIFGPILPIISYNHLEEAIEYVAQGEKPLALYLFTQSKEAENRVMKNLSFGGGCVNDVLIHLSNDALPFGGVGNSGMGSYHGKAGFDSFSHYKSVMKKTNAFDVSIRYSPYKNKLKLLKKIIR